MVLCLFIYSGSIKLLVTFSTTFHLFEYLFFSAPPPKKKHICKFVCAVNVCYILKWLQSLANTTDKLEMRARCIRRKRKEIWILDR